MFSENYLLDYARKTNFIKYSSKLRPHMFIDFLLFRNHDDSKCSLSDFVSALKLRFGIKIKKQSIDERFTEHAVQFVKGLVEKQLTSQIFTKEIEGKSFFKSIKIKDSTRFQISGHLKDIYPGSNGGASGAGLHIQFEYDFLSGSISDLKVTHAKRQDNTDARETIGDINSGDLIIRDMGYFVQKVFKDIMKKGAYFISRLKPRTSLYDIQGKKIDIKKLKLQMEKLGQDRTELLVTTNQIDTPVRLIVERLPEEVVNQRIAKATADARKKGRQLTEEYKSYASLSLYITNVDEKVLPTCSVIKLYHVRWQIELRFKAWKSYCELSKVKKMKRYRFECQLYANLLYILLIWEIAYNFEYIALTYRRKQVSINKLYKTLTEHVHDFRNHLKHSTEGLCIFISNIYELAKENLLLEPRKNKIKLTEIRSLCVDNQANK